MPFLPGASSRESSTRLLLPGPVLARTARGQHTRGEAPWRGEGSFTPPEAAALPLGFSGAAASTTEAGSSGSGIKYLKTHEGSAGAAEMSLESLFEHIIFTEHQAEESRRALREVRSEITRCRGRIKKATEDLNEEKVKLESKVQQFSEKSFLLELLKTHENALERQHSEITNQRDTLLQAFEATKKKAAEEEEKFIKEITDFNDEYEITKKKDILMKENIKMEIADLEKQADVLRGEMKSMEWNSGQLQELQIQKRRLLQELFTVQKKLKVLKDEETEVIYTTKYLEAEKLKVKEKPQHDAECLRLKQELDLYSEDEMESKCKALQTEIEFLESTLAQKGLQDK